MGISATSNVPELFLTPDSLPDFQPASNLYILTWLIPYPDTGFSIADIVADEPQFDEADSGDGGDSTTHEGLCLAMKVYMYCLGENSQPEDTEAEATIGLLVGHGIPIPTARGFSHMS